MVGSHSAEGIGFIAEILRHTPVWVFVLFFVLLSFGLYQTKSRSVAKSRLFVQPLVLIALSLYGVVSSFGAQLAFGLVSWTAGIGVAVVLNRIFNAPIAGLRYSAVSPVVAVPGSWLPLALWMGIFFTKYAVTVALTRESFLREQIPFVIAVCLTYGLLSGVFAVRTLYILRHSTIAVPVS